MIPIVFSTDHNYVMPTGVTICSLLLNKDEEEYDIYVLIASDVSSIDKQNLIEQVNCLAPYSKISFIEMGEKYKGGFEIREISTACYYRLMIPWLIPHKDKIIYCDVDVIFKTNLKVLYEIDLTGKYLAGARPNSKEGWKAYDKYFKKIGVNYKNYINSGVLVINSKLQRENSLDKEYNSLSNKKFLYQDQDIINIVCKDRISYFDYRFNLMPSNYAIKPDLKDNIIIHYAGDKPWKRFTYAWAEWWTVYNSSVFFDGLFYYKMSKNILDLRSQIKSLGKKFRDKLGQLSFKNL